MVGSGGGLNLSAMQDWALSDPKKSPVYTQILDAHSRSMQQLGLRKNTQVRRLSFLSLYTSNLSHSQY